MQSSCCRERPKPSLNQRGVFLTFMAFLLLSTLLVLSTSTSKIEISREKNIVEETAYDEVNRRFNNLRHQIIVAKEGTASQAYAEMTSYSSLNVGEDWFETEQTMPLERTYFENAYDAINLSEVFAEEMSEEGLTVDVELGLLGGEWGGAEEYPEVQYIALPQCLKFSVQKDTNLSDNFIDDNMMQRKGTTSDGCEADFSTDSIEGYQTSIQLPNVTADPLCQNGFAGCSEQPDDDSTPYAKITLTWKNCGGTLEYGFDAQCHRVIAGNLSQGTADWIEVKISDTDWLKVRYDTTTEEIFKVSFTQLGTPPQPQSGLIIRNKTTFKEPIDEIVLAPGIFRFSVQKPGFDICRATDEIMCSS